MSKSVATRTPNLATYFRAGDKVRCTNYRCFAGKLGEVMTVAEVTESFLRMEGHPLSCYDPQSHLELVLVVHEPEYIEVEGYTWCPKHSIVSAFYSGCSVAHEPIYVKRHAHAHAHTHVPEVYDDLLRCECGAEEPLPGVFSL